LSKIYLCAINNISSGNCSEDCEFCTQSAYNKTDIDRYKYKDISQVIKEAHQAYQNKAVGYCLVTAGKGLDDKSLEFVAKTAKAIKKQLPSLSLIGCNGTTSKEQLIELKNAGIDNYNHNLETSKEYYPHICTTHTWKERFDTCVNAKEAGLNLCSGGIFGLGESEDDRVSLISSIKELNPMSIPINFFIPNPALKIKEKTLQLQEALEIIKNIKNTIPNAMIMVAGGREHTFGSSQDKIFEFGANSIVIGDYLTTKGQETHKDLAMLEMLGLEIANNCR